MRYLLAIILALACVAGRATPTPTPCGIYAVGNPATISTGASIFNFDITNTAGSSNTALFVGVAMYDGSKYVNSITYGNQTVNFSVGDNTPYDRVELWYLKNPASGNHAITIHQTGSSFVVAGAQIYGGVGGVSGVTDSTTGTGSSISLSFTTNSDYSWLISMGAQDTGKFQPYANYPGMNTRWNMIRPGGVTSITGRFADLAAGLTGTYPIGALWGTSGNNAFCVAEITPACVSTPTSTPTITATATITKTLTASPTYTITQTITITPSITETHTTSPTPSPSPTPRNTPTPGGVFTYFASSVFRPVAGAQDVFTLSGSPSHVVSVLGVQVYASSPINIKLVRHESISTGFFNLVSIIGNSQFPPATSTAKSWILNPTTDGGIVISAKYGNVTHWAFTSPVILNGVNEELAVNLNGATISNVSVSLTLDESNP